MELPQFPSHPTCTLCNLHETPAIKNPGTPTTPFNPHDHDPLSPTPVLLVVGQNPGYHEDISNTPFVGPSGKILRNIYIPGAHLAPLSTIYITNAARCLSPNNEAPKARHLSACSPYFLQDLSTIHQHHPNSPLYILCLGAVAATAVYRSSHPRPKPIPSLTQSFSHQATPLTFPFTHSTPTSLFGASVFFTFHPAAVLRTGKLIYAVNDHLKLLHAHLTGFEPYPSVPTIVPPSLPPLMLQENP